MDTNLRPVIIILAILMIGGGILFNGTLYLGAVIALAALFFLNRSEKEEAQAAANPEPIHLSVPKGWLMEKIDLRQAEILSNSFQEILEDPVNQDNTFKAARHFAEILSAPALFLDKPQTQVQRQLQQFKVTKDIEGIEYTYYSPVVDLDPTSLLWYLEEEPQGILLYNGEAPDQYMLVPPAKVLGRPFYLEE